MSSESEDDELDAILDEALDGFDVPEKSASAPPKADPNTTGDTLSSSVPPDNNVTDAHAHSAEDEALEAFQEALRSLSEADGAGGADGSVDPPTEEADLKLVEEFMRSLETQFNDMDVSGAGANSAPRTSNVPTGSSSTGHKGNAFEAPNKVERIVEALVGQLLSKDVLKGPMLHMQQLFSKWMPENEGKLSESERERYRKQQRLVDDICAEYETADDTNRVWQLFAQMQECGVPPQEIMDELAADDKDSADDPNGVPPIPPEFEKLAGNCPVQ